ncbi:hypothetical protein PIB30_076654 [Stylosanthes scabra]|uniref:Uncharacterized protein n=1 Tax=Stylosanthes scabra TaxID=79078 RepID=A0ABU6YRP7_9FABA|nr:hypothetical protein [Stylosanthes scabra]
MLLLSTQLFGDKTAARVPLRWLPFVDQMDDLGTARVPPRWLGCTGIFVEPQTEMWLPLQGHCSSYRAGYSGGFLASDLTGSITSVGPWARYLPTSDERDPRVFQYRTMLDRMTHRDFVCRPYMTPEVAFVANPDIWRAEHMGLWTARYLAPADAFYPRPPDEIHVEAFQRVAETPQATQVDDVPDNRRQDRRRMVGTRTKARDWQWLDQMMGDEEVTAPRRVRRMPEGGGRRGGRGGGRSQGRASAARGQHGASTSGAHQAGPSQAGPSQAVATQDSWISVTPQHHFDSNSPVLGSPSHDFLVGLDSPGFQRHL